MSLTKEQFKRYFEMLKIINDDTHKYKNITIEMLENKNSAYYNEYQLVIIDNRSVQESDTYFERRLSVILIDNKNVAQFQYNLEDRYNDIDEPSPDINIAELIRNDRRNRERTFPENLDVAYEQYVRYAEANQVMEAHRETFNSVYSSTDRELRNIDEDEAVFVERRFRRLKGIPEEAPYEFDIINN